MLENLGLLISALCTFSGAALIYDAASSHDASAAFSLIGGATILTAGLVIALLVGRSKLHWRYTQKQYRGRT